MKIAILDDWFNTLRGLPCFANLDGHDVTVFTDRFERITSGAVFERRAGYGAIPYAA